MMALELLPDLLVVAFLGLAIATLLGFSAEKFISDDNEVVSQINRLLPQTQCAQCGHPGCRPYAEAIAKGEDINRCPPGGKQTIYDLANLLGREMLSLDESFGTTAPARIAKIRESECIGCTLCMDACPVDAIVGAAQQMHSVIESVCTGCDLCLPPCPVDCIDMITAPAKLIPLTSLAAEEPVVLQPGMVCIRCGLCEPLCPRQLAPQELFWQRQNSEAMTKLDLNACIECRMCDRACPAEIPLTDLFVETKLRIIEETAKSKGAITAEARYEQRLFRLESDESRIKTRISQTDRTAILDELRKSI